ncbi:MAG: ATP phosphoribosyltransferase regulatory subunit [Ruminococcaceae bacterium]|nr:ATP phosphoribosyltransferase regulatory subunit [Oscillospiraceae bacterium]
MNSKQNFNIPDGTRDLIFSEAELVSDTLKTLQGIYEKNGFRRVMTPAIEYYGVFEKSSAISQENMYKLTDTNGKLIVLRADNTMPIARVASTKLRAETLPLKLCYDQNVYRLNGDYSGKRRENIQSGVEYIGVGGIKSDIVCLLTAMEALASFGRDFKIEIGHVGFFNALIEGMTDDREEIDRIRSYVDRKNTVSLDLIDLPSMEKIRALPLLYGDGEIVARAKELAAGNEKALACLAYVEELYEALAATGYRDNLLVDMGMVQEMDYYTGIVFRGYIEGAGESVLGGGRYDGLMENFGFASPAIGFAINVSESVDVLLRARAKESGRSGVVLHFEKNDLPTAIRSKGAFENSGILCELSPFEDYGQTEEYAKKNGMKVMRVEAAKGGLA